MAKRKIVKIDEDKCTGCGLCVPNCHEGALQIIDNKARLISDLFCDGLGNCLGHCPEGAIEIIEREAEAYDEKKTMQENIVPKGENTIKAHINHLKDHGADEYLKEALDYLKEKNINIDIEHVEEKKMKCGCSGSKVMQFEDKEDTNEYEGTRPSMLRQWPVQLHLVPPTAPYFKGADVLLAADCVAYSLGDFHKEHLIGKSLAIACPKLDSEQEIYIEKITSMIDDAEINTLTVMIMEVPCCGGLLHIAKEASQNAKRKIPIKLIIVGVQGNIVKEEWV